MGGVSDDVLLARAYLSRVADPACIPVWRLVCEVGPVEAAAAIRAGRVDETVRAATQTRAAVADPHADLAAAERHGIRLVVPESADWPDGAIGALKKAAANRLALWAAGSRRTDDPGDPIPPLALWVQGSGDVEHLGARAAGIVGARASTQYGNRIAADLALGLAQHGVDVVSGGAYGIDAAAHRGALAAGGRTVLISAGGLDRPYPQGNAALFDRVRESGLLISESPPGSAPQRHRFLTRNRLIAALSTGVVVVEAAARSGALNTATYCRMLGRPLMAVPGPVTSVMSAGCHALVRRDDPPATLVTSVEHVLQVIGRLGEGLDEDRSAGKRTNILDFLSPTEQRVFDALPAGRPATVGELSVVSGLALREVLCAIPVLERHGIVHTTPDGYRARPIRAAR